MIRSPLHRALVALALSALSTTAPAAIIDFESLAHDGADAVTLGQYEEDGFRLVSNIDPVFADQAFGVWGSASPEFNGSAALFNAYPGFVTTLTSVAGETFTPVSIDVGPLAADIAGSITFLGVTADGVEVMQSFAFGPDLAPPARLVFAPAFASLASLRWEQESVQAHQFDNIDILQTPIPEPRTAALVAAGLLLGVVWTARRRSRPVLVRSER
jgi:hypothetical protein